MIEEGILALIHFNLNKEPAYPEDKESLKIIE
jgi:hypothetical protein